MTSTSSTRWNGLVMLLLASLTFAKNMSHLLFDLHRDLVSIDSITPNEQEVGKYLINFLHDHKLSVEAQPVPHPDSEDGGRQRYNILAYAGESRKTRVLVSSHIDTVPPFYPYKINHTSFPVGAEGGGQKPITDRTIISGRGSVDAKASVTAQIVAFLDLLESGAVGRDDVALLFVVGEETGGDGMRRANDLGLSWDAVVFGEPTEGRLVSGHKGHLDFKVTAKGQAAHSGYPWLGVSANTLIIRALAGLDDLAEGRGVSAGSGLPSSKKYGNTTVNIGRIDGGVAGNVVPETATADIAVRIAGGTVDEVKKLVEKAIGSAVKDMIDKARDDGKECSVEVKYGSEGYGPVDIDHDIKGLGKPFTVNYGTDIPNLKGDHKRYLYGPGSILVAHSDHEAIEAKDLEAAVDDYKRIILEVVKKLEGR